MFFLIKKWYVLPPGVNIKNSNNNEIQAIQTVIISQIGKRHKYKQTLRVLLMHIAFFKSKRAKTEIIREKKILLHKITEQLEN